MLRELGIHLLDVGGLLPSPQSCSIFPLDGDLLCEALDAVSIEDLLCDSLER